jgi:CDP-diacylglycerol--serine O-phosphatidyltransferase
VRKIAILPTLLTLGNAASGFAAIAYASKVGPQPSAHDAFYFVLSACLIVLAMAFDALDGYAARLSKSASDFGGQLDSLCDVVSFGVAPAFLLLRLGQAWHAPVVRQAVALIALLYLACALLRLARFNVENSPDPASHRRFKGLPSPAAAGCIASLAVLRFELPAWTGLDAAVVQPFVDVWAPSGALLVALLMVSRVAYPHMTKQLLRARRPFRFLVQALLVIFVIALAPALAFCLLFWLYALNGLVRHILVRRLRDDALSGHAPGVDCASVRKGI